MQDGTQGEPWTSEKGSRDGDVGEKARLNHAVVRTLCAYSYLRDSQQKQQKILTYVIFRCTPAPMDGVSGRREMKELRTACIMSRASPSVLPFEVRHEQIQIAYRSSVMAKRSAASEVGEWPVVEVVDVTVDVLRREAGDTNEP